MSKEKLTLYVDPQTSHMAHEAAESLGKSVSELVREYTARVYKQIESPSISPSISKWIGVLKTRKSYKSLREEILRGRMRRYENPR